MAWLDDTTLQGVLLGSGAVLVWALALYVASRAPTRRSPMLAAAAMLCLAAYLLGEGLGALAPDLATWARWLQRTWWATSLALPVYLVWTLSLAADEGPEPWARRVGKTLPWLSAAAIAVGVVFAAVGALTPLVQEWSAPFAIGGPGASTRHVVPGPWLPVFQAFALVCLTWSAIN